MNFRNLTFFFSLLLYGQQAVSQSAAPAPDPVAASVALLEKQYHQSAVDYPALFNGPEYVDYSKPYYKSLGHQFFLEPESQPGSAYYNHHYFPDLRLSYDVVLDQVVLQQEPNPSTVRFLNENVRYFTIANHRFVRLVADSLSGQVIRTGFYEVLVEDGVQLLAKRIKRMQERIIDMRVNIEFIPADRLFIRKAGVYYPVNSKGSATRLFADRSKDVQKYIRANKLKFRPASREAALVALTRYYNQLTTR